MIKLIEELSINAWPALQPMLYDGWVLRFANGYTRRANSVNPLYHSTDDTERKIQFCEQIYGRYRLPVTFKMTSSARPENLDEILAGQGYEFDAHTSVQICDLDPVSDGLATPLVLAETFSDEWLSNYCRLNEVNERHAPTLQQMLGNIIPRRCFLSLRHEGRIIACGLGVLQGEHIGLFDIVTDADFRNRGHGRQLVSDLLAWGKQNGARTAYLQVMLNNAPALRLYTRLGFKEIYRYWYRIKRLS